VVIGFFFFCFYLLCFFVFFLVGWCFVIVYGYEESLLGIAAAGGFLGFWVIVVC